MAAHRERTLSRDTPAVQIPSGEPAVLAAGSKVYLTQTLGGSFTVLTDWGLARIAGEHADAIGEAPAGGAPAASAAGDAAGKPGGPDEGELWAQLRNVYDPEIPVNIVDLGLVYSLEMQPREGAEGCKVTARMTLTAPGCGMGPMIAEDAKNRLLLAPGVAEAEVVLVWDPPWNQGMISEEGRMKLGLV
jgi:probable FeS assembly SUF system protein SufT